MAQSLFLSVTEQVTVHLRDELRAGRWVGSMPGVPTLAAELGVNHKTVASALQLLESEGVLVSRGKGCKRLIASSIQQKTRPMRVAILLLDATDREVEFMVNLHHLLDKAGHFVSYGEKTMVELGMKVDRIEKMVEGAGMDAWIVCAGTREILQFFSERPEPAFAFFGRWKGVNIAATKPDKSKAVTEATEHLMGLGHRRIVLLCRELRRLPEPGSLEKAFLAALEAGGVEVGKYHLPGWEESKEGFQKLLDGIFKVTPPTAVIIDESFLYMATQQFLAKRGFGVPEDVSLICTDNDPTFSWCDPSVAHIDWDSRLMVKRVVRWAAAVSRGSDDRRQSLTPAKLVLGGTVSGVNGA